ncbi:uncharacterized protein LOC135366178 [Ornithodoros turicata]|uniref:uncharacterized protein LOC135366178 n=1 Tax=Ornithodoros turicata TaxID=34597 RepID=UPI003138D125
MAGQVRGYRRRRSLNAGIAYVQRWGFTDAFVRNCFAVAVLAAYFASTVLGDSYVTTMGTFRNDKKIGRLPDRGRVYDCLNQCEKTPECYCVRMSNTKKYSCDLLTPFPHGKPLTPKGYIYFAANKYKDTLYNESGTAINYALRKKTMQSSTYELYGILYTSDKAVDGSHNTDGLKPPYFAHTLDSYWNELFPWWMVDLNQEITVTGIRLRNRKEWGDRLHDYDIRVGPQPISAEFNDVPFKLNTRCHYHEKGGIPEEALLFIECKPCPVRGRYVSIQITQNCTDCREPLKNVLQIAEFEVFGLP